jgi:hypothetical protein
VFLSLLTIIAVSLSPPALLANDLAAALSKMASGDQSPAPGGGAWRSDPCASGTSPSQVPLVRQEFLSAQTSASTSVPGLALPKGLFSHAKCEVPAAVVKSGVVQTSAELPLETVQPALLPNARRRQRSASLAPTFARPLAAKPPLPAQIAQAVEPSAAPLPTLEQQLAGHPKATETCISPRDLKSIRQITADISVSPADLTGSKRLPPECSLGDTPSEPRKWHRITFAWTAASTCHNPVYFDDEQLERYGHSWGPVKQTAVSAVQFFATVPLVPYFMGVYPPNECIYDLGQYQPGSCAPYYLDPLPLSVRGALYEGSFLGLIPVL